MHYVTVQPIYMIFYSAKAPLVIYTVKDRKETFALGEVFHGLSTATSRLERERV